MDKHERKNVIDEKLAVPTGALSIGITWIEGKVIFRDDKKWSKSYFGVCHYSKGVFIVTPVDWPKVTMLTTIQVEPTAKYCDRAHTCLNFKCKLNRFNKSIFIAEFKDMGEFTLGLPRNLGKKPLWFSAGKWEGFWGRLCMQPESGILKYNEDVDKRIIL